MCRPLNEQSHATTSTAHFIGIDTSTIGGLLGMTLSLYVFAIKEWIR